MGIKKWIKKDSLWRRQDGFFAVPNILGGGVPAAGGVWHYPGTGTYDHTYADSLYILGAGFTGFSGNITKISFFLSDVLTATACKVYLYKDPLPIMIPVTGGIVNNPTTGWNDLTITSTAMLVTDTFSVIFRCNADIVAANENDTGSGGLYGDTSYANIPVNPFSGGSDTSVHAVRMWVE